jgi:uncharacterized membrane protein
MKKINAKIIAAAIILLSFAIAAYLYPTMPEKMASHWDAQGNVNGYMGKFWGMFLMPVISAVVFGMLLVIPRIDPLRNNIAAFRPYFDNFIVLTMGFLFYIYLLTLAWNFGARFEMTQMLVPAFAILFYYTGIMIEHAKKNWSIGIRTPWTLSNDKVWDKTHKLGGRMFKYCGIVSLAGALLPQEAIAFIIIPMVLTALYLVVYSYLEYQKIRKK